ncbi:MULTISPECIES: 4-hydroxybenzoate 3-monooxygenase [Kitasatospora]|uniref:4-hydroxybenzoate 3-monooxygenase n=1 Tax=Kitasatospora cathayae TaxID=3004092 RepID=A0ABY7PY03_9ACTN|nr:4-hydroxybenzoate 3-monooxygenase [Kitasatospora sp. HUAS 3-15]WBP85276.1 4-hydroxybenzoate 3-monooxygenase [Kitasatospora sp. HUAS 3-15]
MTERQTIRTARESADVLILGAGPAGLTLANLLHAAGIDCVVLERADRAHVQTRARAGFLAANTVRVLERHGLADGLHRRGRPHGTCEFRTEDGSFRLDYGALGRHEQHTVYPQQDLVTDLLTHYLDAGGRIHFETEARTVQDAAGPRPTVAVQEADGRPDRWRARYVAGCDGRHGAARRSLPTGTLRHHRDHGVTWLGLLAEAPPSLDAVGYALHPHGFAGHMARTADITRYYLQYERGIPADAWSEERIWAELDLRMYTAEHGPLHHGRILQRSVIDLESDVIEPLRHGSLLLAGDAASLPAPAAAKGANLAVLEAELLAEALIDELAHHDSRALDRYSRRCLEHIWRAQEFAHWMIQLLHAPAGPDEGSYFHEAMRRSRIESLRTSRTHQDWFAENYVGI